MQSEVISQSRPRVVVVDDDLAMRDILRVALKDDFDVVVASGAKEGLSKIVSDGADVVLLDIMMGDGNGIDVLKKIKEHQERIEVIMITVVKDLRTAVEAMKFGAYDYINKDFNFDELKIIIRKALEKRNLRSEVRYLRSEIRQYTDVDFVAGTSTAIKQITAIVERVAQMPSNVLIQGDSGTGKEVVARRIHALGNEHLPSDAPYRPFISINLASIPSELLESTLFGHEKGSFTGAHRSHVGKFELADGGTLFLDEISELKLELQAKLLRAIQEREIERVGGEAPIKVNVRIIAATNRNLQDMVKQKLFREDLFYRLNVIPIVLPKLKERIDDMPALVSLFLSKYSKKLNKCVTSVDDKVMSCFQFYQWPGNIRELENVIERMIALADSEVLSEDVLPIELRFSEFASKEDTNYEEMLGQAVDAFEKKIILASLQKNSWNQVKTSMQLGIHRKTLEYKIKRLSLHEIIDKSRKGKNNDDK